MAAIITSEFRKNSRKIFTNDIKSSTVDDYFIGLGKTDSWPDTADAEGNQVTEYSRQFSAPLPIDTTIMKTDVLKNLLVLVKTDAAEVFNVIPRNNWAFNRIYKTYDPTDPRCFDYETIDGIAHYPCYVTSNDRVYMCLSNIDSNGDIIESTTAIPSGAGASQESYHTPAKLSDAYLWAYVTSLDEDSKFYTDQFVNYTYPSPSDEDFTQIANTTGGLVYGFKINYGGGDNSVNVDSAELNLVGTTRDTQTGELQHAEDVEMNSENGFDVVFGANAIESITYIETQGVIPWRKGYVSASVSVKVDNVISETIEIVPYVLPYDGLGRYPDNDLPSYYAGIAVDFIGEVDGEAPVGYAVDVRQISLVKNPQRNPAINQSNDNDDDTNEGFYVHDEAYDALKYIQLPPTTLVKDYIGRDFIIEQEGTGARAWLDISDNQNERLYYHQNSSPLVNFKRFEPEGEGSIKITTIGGFWDEETYTCLSANDPEYLPETGEVIFYENRKPINRNYNQTDEVKLVIQF